MSRLMREPRSNQPISNLHSSYADVLLRVEEDNSLIQATLNVINAKTIRNQEAKTHVRLSNASIRSKLDVQLWSICRGIEDLRVAEAAILITTRRVSLSKVAEQPSVRVPGGRRDRNCQSLPYSLRNVLQFSTT